MGNRPTTPPTVAEMHVGLINDLAITRDSKRLVTAGSGGRLIVWDIASGNQELNIIAHESYVSSVGLLPDDQHLLSSAKDGTVKMWRLSDGALVRTFNDTDHESTTIAVSPDARYAAFASGDKTVRVWDLQSGRCHLTLPDFQRWMFWALRDEVLIAAANKSPDILAWHVPTGQIRFRQISPYDDLNFMTAAGPYVACSYIGENAHVVLRSINDGEVIADIEVPGTSSVWSFASLSGNRAAIPAAEAGQIVIWDIDSNRPLKTLHDPTIEMLTDTDTALENKPVWDKLAVAPDGRLIAGSTIGTLAVWDVQTGERLYSSQIFVGWTHLLAITPDGRYAIVSENSHSDINRLVVWNLESGRLHWSASTGKRVTRTLPGAGRSVDKLDPEVLRFARTLNQIAPEQRTRLIQALDTLIGFGLAKGEVAPYEQLAEAGRER